MEVPLDNLLEEPRVKIVLEAKDVDVLRNPRRVSEKINVMLERIFEPDVSRQCLLLFRGPRLGERGER
jgi:hypothetical protein